MMDNQFTKTLFRPFHYRQLNLSNRIVMAPMSRNKSPNGIPDINVVNYYKRRAEGGVGLIITEGTLIPHKAAHNGNPGVPYIYGDALQGWRDVVSAVHNVGGKIISQLWHVGATRDAAIASNPEIPAYAPSAVVHPFMTKINAKPKAMTLKDVDEVIAAYVQAAKNAKTIGFDGIEVHGAHGYLIDQFFWSVTNHRDDRFGGLNLTERTRFAAEVIAAIRAEVGQDFPIVFRYSQWKMGDYDYKMAHTPNELANFLTPLVDAGVDIFHCSTRRFYQAEFPMSSLNLAGWTKKLVNKPSITVGSIGLDVEFNNSLDGAATKLTNISELLIRMNEEEFDLVAVGRSLIADPNWPRKIAANDYENIKVFNREMLASLY